MDGPSNRRCRCQRKSEITRRCCETCASAWTELRRVSSPPRCSAAKATIKMLWLCSGRLANQQGLPGTSWQDVPQRAPRSYHPSLRSPPLASLHPGATMQRLHEIIALSAHLGRRTSGGVPTLGGGGGKSKTIGGTANQIKSVASELPKTAAPVSVYGGPVGG